MVKPVYHIYCLLLLVACGCWGCSWQQSAEQPLPVQEAEALLAQAKTHAANPLEAANYATEAIALLERAKQESLLPRAYNTQGVYFLRANAYPEAAKSFLNSLDNNSNNVAQKAYAYYKLGDVYRKVGFTSEAVANYEKALSLYQELNDTKRQAYCQFNIGWAFLFADPKQPIEAEIPLKESLRMAELIEDSNQIRISLSELILLYIELDNLALAGEYVQQLTHRFPELPDRNLVLYQLSKAEIARKHGDLTGANVSFEAALVLLQENPKNELYLYGHAAYADFLLNVGRNTEAASLLETAIANAPNLSFYNESLYHSYYLLGQHYKTIGQPQKAMAYIEKQNALLQPHVSVIDRLKRQTQLNELRAVANEVKPTEEAELALWKVALIGMVCFGLGLLTLVPRLRKVQRSEKVYTQHARHMYGLAMGVLGANPTAPNAAAKSALNSITVEPPTPDELADTPTDEWPDPDEA